MIRVASRSQVYVDVPEVKLVNHHIGGVWVLEPNVNVTLVRTDIIRFVLRIDLDTEICPHSLQIIRISNKELHCFAQLVRLCPEQWPEQIVRLSPRFPCFFDDELRSLLLYREFALRKFWCATIPYTLPAGVCSGRVWSGQGHVQAAADERG